MSKYSYGNQQDVMLRKEKAGQKANAAYRRSGSIKYEVIDDDILILSGPYANKKIKELWILGPPERDYIIEKLWSVGDEEVVKVINNMVCR